MTELGQPGQECQIRGSLNNCSEIKQPPGKVNWSITLLLLKEELFLLFIMTSAGDWIFKCYYFIYSVMQQISNKHLLGREKF